MDGATKNGLITLVLIVLNSNYVTSAPLSTFVEFGNVFSKDDAIGQVSKFWKEKYEQIHLSHQNYHSRLVHKSLTKRQAVCDGYYTCDDGYFCCPSSGVVEFCCNKSDFCINTTVVGNMFGFVVTHWCCKSPNHKPCQIPGTCCNQTDTCCGYDCCDINQPDIICCGNHPSVSLYGPLCAPRTECCVLDDDCPDDFTCCGRSCCPSNSSTRCCINQTCTVSQTCSCSTGDPTDMICTKASSSYLVPSSDKTVLCCGDDQECCDGRCCDPEEVCCLDFNRGNQCVQPEQCCSVACNLKQHCCSGGNCVSGIQCLQTVEDVIDYLTTLGFFVLCGVLLGLALLFLVLFLSRNMKCPCTEKVVVEEFTMEDIKEIKKQNKYLKEEHEMLERQAEEYGKVLEKVDDVDLEELEDENKLLQEENQQLKDEIEKKQKKAKTPILLKKNTHSCGDYVTLTFCKKDSYDDIAFPTHSKTKMGAITKSFCEENSLSLLRWYFYTIRAPRQGKFEEEKKRYVDQGKTVEENGFGDGQKIFYDEVPQNKIWGIVKSDKDNL